MVPTRIAAETFRLFHAITQERIDSDLEDAPDNYTPMGELIQAHYKLGEEELTPELCADFLHNQLIQACAGMKHPLVDDRVAFHLVGIAARTAARVAVDTAAERGELGDLNKKMDAIRDAANDEYFDERHAEDQPKEYVELAERAGQWLGKIEDMMMIDILKKYRLREAAELFETDEATFDEKVREGYYVLFPEKRKKE